jgi:hypothetical protein|tara:strand:- start:634 stop:1380 length:747 start_codon:yes stop_codon:yes gene_type:complete
MKNIVFMISFKNNGQLKKEYQISIDSWKHFCKKHDAELLLMEEPVMDVKDMHIIWQRYYLFDILEANKIDYDQIMLVDADTIVHPDSPNFFEMTDNKYCLVHDDGSYDWILRGMEHYKKHIFKNKNEWFDFWDYGNSGFQIVNKKHRPFFDEMREFYFEYQEIIQFIQSNYGIGTDQTPLNFMLRKHNIDLKLLPWKCNMMCMGKREILGEDMLHTKMGHIMHFNGLPGKKEEVVPYWMEKTYNYLYK